MFALALVKGESASHTSKLKRASCKPKIETAHNDHFSEMFKQGLQMDLHCSHHRNGAMKLENVDLHCTGLEDTGSSGNFARLHNGTCIALLREKAANHVKNVNMQHAALEDTQGCTVKLYIFCADTNSKISTKSPKYSQLLKSRVN